MIFLYPAAAIAAFIWNLLPFSGVIPELSYCLYCVAVVGWGLTIEYRILQKNVRMMLLTCAVFLILLFLMRICRYEFFASSSVIRQYMRYGYHVAFMIISLLSVMIALSVGKDEQERPLRHVKYLWIPQIIMCIIILTNSKHRWMFGITPFPVETFTHKWFYFVTVAWEIILGIAALAILLRRCLVLASRRKWYIPAFFVSFGLFLLIFYLVSGGAPKIGDLQIYNLQEAFAFMFISSFESAIRIGLIPSNTDYDKVFFNSHINAVICDNERGNLFSSLGYRAHTGWDNRVRTQDISGGILMWIEDLSTITMLNAELRRITEQVEEENELISQENDLQRERIGYETRNRLYDRIALAVRPQAKKVGELLEKSSDESLLKSRMLQAVVLGTYIKRLGNLLLIADENPAISTEELGISIRESFEYLSLSGYACELIEETALLMPSDVILYAYAVFERVIEAAYPSMHACFITFTEDPDGGAFAMEIAVDTKQQPDLSFSEDSGITNIGTMTQETEDGTTFFRFRLPRGEVSV